MMVHSIRVRMEVNTEGGKNELLIAGDHSASQKERHRPQPLASTSHPLQLDAFTCVWEAGWQSAGEPGPVEATGLIH